jgi:hypothetical protein
MIEIDEVLAEPIAAVRTRERTALDAMLAAARGQVVLAGCGNLGRQALACLRSIGVSPLAFTDNNRTRWHSEIEGLVVLPPPDAARRFGADALFLVTIWNSFHWYLETERQLTSLGCAHVAPVSALYWKFPETFLPFNAQDLPHRVFEQSDDVRMAAGIWSDEISRREYAAQIAWRARGTWTFERTGEGESYFLTKLFQFVPDEAVVDCGAFDGDTLAAFLALRDDQFHRYVAIEADDQLFAKLRQSVASLRPQIRDRIELVQGFVGAPGKPPATVAIDGLRRGEEPITLIKMDIEGAEGDALAGARTVIRRDRPVLTVCVYHTQSDLWRLPLMIKALVPDYAMYLRRHEGDGWQTVAYAVPPDRLV